MATDSDSADPRFKQLADQMAELARRVDLLSRRVDGLTAAQRDDRSALPPADTPHETRQDSSPAGELSTILTSSAAVSCR